MKGIILLLFAIVLSGTSFAQKSSNKTVEIKTSAECGQCKDRIEGTLNYMKGVQFAELDVHSKIVTVKYNTGKTSLDAIRKKISEVGYDADDVKAIPASVKKLPACCKPGGMKK